MGARHSRAAQPRAVALLPANAASGEHAGWSEALDAVGKMALVPIRPLNDAALLGGPLGEDARRRGIHCSPPPRTPRALRAEGELGTIESGSSRT